MVGGEILSAVCRRPVVILAGTVRPISREKIGG